MSDRLDAALVDLGTRIELPPTPDLRAVVAERIAAPRPSLFWMPSRWPRAVALAVAVTLLLAATAAAIVLVLPGLRLTVVPSLPAGSVAADALGTRFALGEPVDLDAVQHGVPAALGSPDEVFASHGTEVISLVYLPDARLPEIGDTDIGLLLQEIAGSLERERVEKLVIEFGVTVDDTMVGDAEAFWIHGRPHVVRYTGPDGAQRSEATRLVSDVLVWERDGVLYRIESGLGLAETLRIAESIP